MVKTMAGYHVGYLADEQDFRVVMLDQHTGEILELESQTDLFSTEAIDNETNEEYTALICEISFCPVVVMPLTISRKAIAIEGTKKPFLLNALNKYGIDINDVEWKSLESIKI